MEKLKKYLPYFLAAMLLLIWYNLFLTKEINLVTADLGRHLKNGELVFQNPKLLTTNFYSYTYPDYSFINHHWLGGVIFYFISKIAGFFGLSLFFIALSFITFLLFFRIAYKEAGLKIAIPVALLIIPLLGERVEIRPEVFSYFFSALFFWILWKYKNREFSFRWLFILPLIEIIWINTHIYFFMGPLLIGLFCLEEIIRHLKEIKPKILDFLAYQKALIITLALSIAATLLNPFGIKGMLTPLKIFENYGYPIVENQSVRFLENYGIVNPNFLLFKITFLILFLSLVLVVFANRRRFSLVYSFLGIFLGVMASLALRNFTLFGFFALPTIACSLRTGLAKIKLSAQNAKITAILAVLAIFLFTAISYGNVFQNKPHLGLAPRVNASADFFKQQKISGPIFNNYDIGGYLIYNLYPENKVFVDNRPEAYPANFFQETYIPMQENEDTWKRVSEQYNFNAIFFSISDITPWGQQFLTSRLDDPDWIPVFADNYAIIFLKNTEANKSLIEKFKIPRENLKFRNR
jgi:hypothetical protein